jgi:dipeptidyl aminopeptidase/acylaminoacyl peptidase
MNRLIFGLVLLTLVGCHRPQKPEASSSPANLGGTTNAATSLAEARKGFQSKLTGHKANEPVDVPPAKLFRKVEYTSPTGKLAAYLTPDPKDGKKHPAIIWITGGDCNSIGDVWSPARPADDQSARQYREAGIVMMFPSLRGGNNNPGVQEGFLGEVDDVLAAADYLAKQEYVDPQRIYLGGHSTGGTLVMLVAESTDRFRAVFSFGPVDDVSGYGPEYTPFDRSSEREIALRSPGRWLQSIKCPLFVFEGTSEGNLESLQTMARASTNSKAHFFPVKGASHFSILAPTNRLIAQKILRDEGAATNITLTEAELNRAFGR